MGIDLPSRQERGDKPATNDLQSQLYPHPFWKMQEAEVISVLESKKTGLRHEEVEERLLLHGRNEIDEKKGNGMVDLILKQLLDPIVLVLFGAAIVSFITGDSISAGIIIAIVVISSAIELYQEYRSEKAVDKLKGYLKYKATVIRDGRAALVDAGDIVPGDVVALTVGDRVPADIRLISADNMAIDESVLTGEYCPAEKSCAAIEEEKLIPQDMANIAFTGGVVSDGKGEGVVVATGGSTLFGKAAAETGVRDESNFQIELKRFGGLLLRAALISALFVLIINVYFGHSVVTSLLFAVVLAVGLVPESLPFIVTILLSNGASKLADNGVIVKRLSATEDLGNVDVLCCDKTGSLTENKLHVADYFDLGGKRSETPLILSLRCNSATVIDHHVKGDPIDVSIAEYGKNSRRLSSEAAKYKKVYEIPFDFDRRRMSVVVRNSKDKKYLLIAKGAPEAILAVSSRVIVNGRTVSISTSRERISKTYAELSEKGYRTIAVGMKEMSGDEGYSKASEKDLTFIGFVTFFDPPKKSVKKTLMLAKKAGIGIKILTGDGGTVTRAIARRVGLDATPEQVVVGVELEEILDNGDFDRLEKTLIFARMTPDQKFRVVKALKSRGHVVAYLGDGVNDAPPLTAADVGITVNDSTDIAKDAADVVLTEKDLNPIVDGILQGRSIFANIVKYIRCILAGNFAQLYTVALASLFLGFVPLLPVQMLLINFLTDMPLIAISTDSTDEEELRTPKKWNVKDIVKNGAIFGGIAAVFYIAFVLVIMNSNERLFQSALYLELLVSELIVILSLRTIKPFYKATWPSTALIAAIFLLMVIGIVAVIPPFSTYLGFQTPPLELIALTFVVALAYAITNELAKRQIFGGSVQPKVEIEVMSSAVA